MNAHEIVEFAALFAVEGPALIAQSKDLPPASVQDYWLFSRCRLDRWGRSLQSYSDGPDPAEPERRQAQTAFLRELIAEILITDVLTRVAAAVVCTHQWKLNQENSGTLVCGIYLDHQQCRQRALRLVLESKLLEGVAEELDRLRRRIERWTDLLLGYVMRSGDISRFGYDADRVRDFGEEISGETSEEITHQGWEIYLASLQIAFRNTGFKMLPNDDQNRQIVGSLLAALPAGSCDSIGTVRSLYALRMLHTADHAERLIQDLLHAEAEPVPKTTQVVDDGERERGGK